MHLKAILLRHWAGLVVVRAAALVGHFGEQQVGELLDIVAIRYAVVAKDVAVVPGFLDDRCHSGMSTLPAGLALTI